MKREKWVLVLVLGILLIFSAPALAVPNEAGTEPAFAYGRLYPARGQMPDTVAVFGFGNSRGVPEEAHVSFGLTVYAPTVGEVQETYRQLLTQITTNIGQKGVPRDSISNQYFNIWSEYGYGDNTGREPELTGYRVNSTISVRLTDISLVSGVIDAAFAAGANRLEGIRYTASREVKREALLAALEDARAQAESAAVALNRGLGEVLVVDQSNAPPYELCEERFHLGSESGFEPQYVEVNQYVKMVFRLD